MGSCEIQYLPRITFAALKLHRSILSLHRFEANNTIANLLTYAHQMKMFFFSLSLTSTLRHRRLIILLSK